MNADEWDELAIRVVRDVLRREIAMVTSELEAKVCDSRAPESPMAINPHHVTNARRHLIAAGELRLEQAQTRGGHLVETISLIEAPISKVQDVSARKRALHARYLGWAMGTKRYPNGLIGPAAERVVDAALANAAGQGAGYRILPKDGRGVMEVFGVPVPTGPLDAAAFHMALDANGLPTPPTLFAIEVKNVRSWIYPSAAELYQVLEKASLLQRAQPAISVVPILVCRRGHATLFRMAKHLGFYVVDPKRQYLLPSNEIDPGDLNEVRAELGYIDLIQWTDDPYVAQHFAEHLPTVAARSAALWRSTAESDLPRLFNFLRRPTLSLRERGSAMDALREAAADLPGQFPSGW